ncbi:MAG: response regulator [Acidobacteria bacterium]|nr:response regulator [Acidobacteriota bacterium]
MALDLTDHRIRVLLCDDDESELRSIEMTIRLSNRTIELVGTATSATELLALAKDKDSYDVAIVDLNMPRIDGLEAARRLKEQCPDRKVVILTAHDDRRDEVERSPDVDLFIDKIEVETIDHRLMELMGLAEAKRAKGGFFSRLIAH